MNRIILIGNGFDLAHGLPTRYEDFINWYWEKRVDSFTGNLTPISEDCLCSIRMTSDNYNRCWNVFAFNLPRYFSKPRPPYSLRQKPSWNIRVSHSQHVLLLLRGTYKHQNQRKGLQRQVVLHRNSLYDNISKDPVT